MPQRRGSVLSAATARRLLGLARAAENAEQDFREAVAQALIDGASVPEVAAATGLPETTVQIYGREFGWPAAQPRGRSRDRRAQLAALNRQRERGIGAWARGPIRGPR